MKMRFVAALSLALGVLSGAAAAADPVELTFRFNDPEQAEMRAALDVFEKNNPGIKVKMERVAWKDVRDQFLREAAVGQGPDVVHIAFVNAREMADAEAILPIDALAAKSPPNAGVDDFIATVLARGKNGKLFALPWTMDTWAMAYRKDILDKAGVKDLPRTWDELAAASTKVKQNGGAMGFGFPAGSASSGSIWFLANYKWWSAGKTLVQQQNGTFTVGLDGGDVASAMTYFKRFFDAGEAPRSLLGVSDWGDPAILSGMIQGTFAIGAMPPATYRQMLELYEKANPGKPLPFESGPIPGDKEHGISHLGGRMLAINANTKHAEESWKLITFLNSQYIFTDIYKNQFPAQRSLLQKIDFGPGMKGYAEQLQNTRPWGPYIESPAPLVSLWNVAGRSFGAALAGQKPVDAAAKDFMTEAERLIKTGR